MRRADLRLDIDVAELAGCRLRPQHLLHRQTDAKYAPAGRRPVPGKRGFHSTS